LWFLDYILSSEFHGENSSIFCSQELSVKSFGFMLTMHCVVHKSKVPSKLQQLEIKVFSNVKKKPNMHAYVAGRKIFLPNTLCYVHSLIVTINN